MKFYKKTNGKWVIGNNSGIPASNCIEYTNPQTGAISIIKEVGKGTYADNLLPTEFQDANGNYYTDLAIYELATKDFFIGSVSGGSGGADIKSFSVEITRPANATIYTAGDVVGDVSTITKLFQNVAKAIGTGVRIYRVRIQTNDTGVLAGSKFNLHIYQDAPDLTGITDNGAFAISYANAIKRAGKIPVVMDGSMGANDYNVIGINPVGRNITVMLETVSGFTPSANSTKFTLVIDCELSNN